MPVCPKCGKKIDFLINYVRNITEEFRTTLNNRGEPEYEYVDTFLSGSDSVYACPECDEDLFDSEEEAVEFLKQK